MKILDIGCGNNKHKFPHHSTIGLDIVPTLHTDVIYNMEKFPYPFHDNTFNKIIMSHTLEHISKENQANIKIIEEIHRLLKPSGILIVDTILGHAFNYDPTHKNPVTFWYWKYFSHSYSLNFYTKTRFKLIKNQIIAVHGFPHSQSLTPIFNYLYQKSPPAIERIINFLSLDIEVKYILIKEECGK